MAHHRKAVIHKHVYELWIIYARAQVHCSNFFPRARILNKCQGYWKKGGLDIKIQWFFWFSLWSLLESRWYRFHKEKHCDSIWSSLRTKLDFLSELHIFWFLLITTTFSPQFFYGQKLMSADPYYDIVRSHR